jgi:serine/threonine-protein phosphatase 2A regulatory subunit B'
LRRLHVILSDLDVPNRVADDTAMDIDNEDRGMTAEPGDEDDMTKDLEKFDERPQQQPRFRRKSVLPVDETVLNELSRHKSLEEILKSKNIGE